MGSLNINQHCFWGTKMSGVDPASTSEQTVHRVRLIASTLNPITCQPESAIGSDLTKGRSRRSERSRLITIVLTAGFITRPLKDDDVKTFIMEAMDHAKGNALAMS